MSSNNNLKLGEPIPYSQAVPASMDRVWQVISEPGNLVYFHPFCESNPVEVWPGVGSSDKVCYYNGLVLERDFTNWIEGSGYDLMASAEEGLQFKVTWRITGVNGEKSALNITIQQVIGQDSEKKVNQFNRMLAKYLGQVLQGFEFYMRTGERVTRNQFGSHRLFSPPVAEK